MATLRVTDSSETDTDYNNIMSDEDSDMELAQLL
jgi:hypothetical protein